MVHMMSYKFRLYEVIEIDRERVRTIQTTIMMLIGLQGEIISIR